jgi:hypothetical protein
MTERPSLGQAALDLLGIGLRARLLKKLYPETCKAQPKLARWRKV